jgi:hypothetical protein
MWDQYLKFHLPYSWERNQQSSSPHSKFRSSCSRREQSLARARAFLAGKETYQNCYTTRTGTLDINIPELLHNRNRNPRHQYTTTVTQQEQEPSTSIYQNCYTTGTGTLDINIPELLHNKNRNPWHQYTRTVTQQEQEPSTSIYQNCYTTGTGTLDINNTRIINNYKIYWQITQIL